MAEIDEDKRASVAKEFKLVVNMSASALNSWLNTPESRGVGMTHKGERVTNSVKGGSVGHEMGLRIIAIQAKKTDDLDAADYATMRKVIGYVHRHLKQRPHGNVKDTRWRRSLMNWGHDPLSKSKDDH